MIRVLASLIGDIVIVALLFLLFHFSSSLPAPIVGICTILLLIGFMFTNFGINELEYAFYEPAGDYKIVEVTRADNTKEYHPLHRLFWFVWAYMNYDCGYGDHTVEACKTMEQAQQVITLYEAARIKTTTEISINIINH